MTEGKSESAGARFAGWLPGLTAAVVGTLYVVGVTLEAGELRGAHVGVRDVLPKIPLQQSLARGVAVAGSAFLLWVLLVLFLGFMYLLVPAVESRLERSFLRWKEDFAAREEEWRKARLRLKNARLIGDAQGELSAKHMLDALRGEVRRNLRKWRGRLVLDLVVILVSLAFLVLFLPPIIGLSVVAAGALMGVSRRRSSRSARLLVSMPIVLLGVLCTAFVQPQGLSHVQLSMQAGPPISGLLAASTGDAWYVVGLRGRVEVVNASAVAIATVAHAKAWNPESGLQLLGVNQGVGRW